MQNTPLKLGPPTPDLMYRIHYPLGLELLYRLKLGLSHLKKYRFKHNFKNCINPLYTGSLEVESTKHFFPALLLLFSTPYFFLKLFKQHPALCAIFNLGPQRK